MERITAILHLEPGSGNMGGSVIRRALGPIRGVVSLALDATDGVIVVRYEPDGPAATDLAALVRAVEDTGLRVRDIAVRTGPTDLRRRPLKRLRTRAS